MERTIWILAVTLTGMTGVGCKDSNRNYIAFDAQVTDTKSDTPALDAVHDTLSDAVIDGAIAVDGGRDSVPDVSVADTGATDADDAEASASDGATIDTEQGQ